MYMHVFIYLFTYSFSGDAQGFPAFRAPAVSTKIFHTNYWI